MGPRKNKGGNTAKKHSPSATTANAGKASSSSRHLKASGAKKPAKSKPAPKGKIASLREAVKKHYVAIPSAVFTCIVTLALFFITGGYQPPTTTFALPRVAFTVGEPTDPADPLSFPFKIENAGESTLHKVKFTCTFDDISANDMIMAPFFTAPTEFYKAELPSKGYIVKPCGFLKLNALAKPIERLHIELYVNIFYTPFLPYFFKERKQSQLYTIDRLDDGKFKVTEVTLDALPGQERLRNYPPYNSPELLDSYLRMFEEQLMTDPHATILRQSYERFKTQKRLREETNSVPRELLE